MDAVSYDLVGILSGDAFFESTAMDDCVESTDGTTGITGTHLN